MTLSTGAPVLPRPESFGSVTSLLEFCDKAGAELVATIDGLSMTPGLLPGTRVRLRPADPKSVRPGDVIAFQHNSRLIAHRVVHLGRSAASRGYLLTCGDAMLLSDVPVRGDAIIGVVTAKVVDGDWVPLATARASGRKYRVSVIFTTVIGALLEVSPAAAARLTRWAYRGCAVIAALRATLGVTRAPGGPIRDREP